MKKKIYYWTSIIHAILTVLFMSMVENNLGYGVIAVICLISCAGYSDLYYHEKFKTDKLIRSNADEDRPE